MTPFHRLAAFGGHGRAVRWTTRVCVALGLGVLLGSTPRAAVPAATVTQRLPTAVPIWTGGAPGALGTADEDVPVLYPYLSDPASRTGAGVLIVPGVDATGLRLEKDGAEVATWLSGRGIAAFVLRYRRAPRYAAASSAADVNRALQYIKAHAGEFGVASSRVGVMGFAEGATLEAEAVYDHAVGADPATPDVVARQSSAPAFMALLYGAAPLAAGAAAPPPTFLVGSTRTGDGQGAMVDLWARLRAARTPVDAHFFARADARLGLATGDASVGRWPEVFYIWVRARGFLTDVPRVALQGMVRLNGRPLPHGYVVFTPIDQVGAGPIVGQVLNSTANVPIGQFTVPADRGPTPGRYRVEVHQNANRWLSNSFTGRLTADSAFGHSRILSPSIDDHRVYGKVRPTDRDDYVIEIAAGQTTPIEIGVWSADPPVAVTPPRIDGLPAPDVANPGVAAYHEQLKYTPNPVPGIPEPILLWPGGAPGAVPDASGAFTDEDKPALYAFPAAAASNTGAAVLVLPGGAFTNRGMDQEGVQIARWLNRHGIGGFVLRYRIRPNYNGQVSVMDAHRAMRYLRANAARFGLSPDRIGTIGFSAGSELEGDAFFNGIQGADPGAADPVDRQSAASNFNMLIYGGRNVRDPAAVPPTFMFVTIEDGGNHLAPEINVLNGLRGAGIPVEAHWYQDGPHGTSMSPGDPQLGQWPDLAIRWMTNLGLLGAGGAAAPAPSR